MKLHRRWLVIAALLAIVPALLAAGARSAGSPAQTPDPDSTAPDKAGPAWLYPDPDLTPGDTFLDVTADQVCTPGYARGVRNVPASERAAVFRRYYLDEVPGAYEVDHFIPLELGGSNAITNLWPERYDPPPGAHQKDVVEDYLHAQVCAGLVALADAQAEIVQDWYAIFLQLTTATAHTWYTSIAQTATAYYCDDDPLWQTLSPTSLRGFAYVSDLLLVYPGRHLHRPCLDGATGP